MTHNFSLQQFNKVPEEFNQATCWKLFQAVPSFIAHADVAHSSKATYLRCLKRFFNWIFSHYHKELILNREHILLYKSYLDGEGLKPHTRSSYLVSTRRFFEWTETVLLYPNIAKGIKGVKGGGKSHNKDSLSLSMLEVFLQSISTDSLINKRDYTLIYLLIHTGLRLIEVCRAQIGDIEMRGEDGLLWVRGKGREGKDAFVVLTSEVLLVVRNYLASRKDAHAKKFLFVSLSDRNFDKPLTTFSLSRIIKERLITAGLKTKRITAHSLRHTFGVLAIKSGVSLYDVQLAMRHLSPQTTQVYLSDIEKEKRMEGLPEQGVAGLLKARLKKNALQ